jgi:hypothetical protein
LEHIKFIKQTKNPIEAALEQGVENDCVCWTGREFIFTPLCLYATISNRSVLSLEPRLKDTSRMAQKTTQFYPNWTLAHRVSISPSQPLGFPTLLELDGKIHDFVQFNRDLEAGRFSDTTKIWLLECLTRGLSLAEASHNGLIVPKAASSLITYRIINPMLFDILISHWGSATPEEIKKISDFEPFCRSPSLDIRETKDLNPCFFDAVWFPVQLFMFCPSPIMRYQLTSISTAEFPRPSSDHKVSTTSFPSTTLAPSTFNCLF